MIYESNKNNYPSIIFEWLSRFVDKKPNGLPLLYRVNPPSENEQKEFEKSVFCVYSAFEGIYGEQFLQSISFYSVDSSYTSIFKKSESLRKELEEGVILHGDNIYIYIEKGNPFIQDKGDSDIRIKGYYINLLVQVYDFN